MPYTSMSRVLLPLLPPLTLVACIFLNFFFHVSFHVLNIFRLPLRFFSKNLWTDRRRAESQVRKPFDLRDDPLIRVILAKVQKWRSRNEVETKNGEKAAKIPTLQTYRTSLPKSSLHLLFTKHSCLPNA